MSMHDAAKEFGYRTHISGGNATRKTIISTHMEFRSFDQAMRFMDAVHEFISREHERNAADK